MFFHLLDYLLNEKKVNSLTALRNLWKDRAPIVSNLFLRRPNERVHECERRLEDQLEFPACPHLTAVKGGTSFRSFPHCSFLFQTSLIDFSLKYLVILRKDFSSPILNLFFQTFFSRSSLSSNKMPVATSAGGEARLKAFKNRGKDTEVNILYLLVLTYPIC